MKTKILYPAIFLSLTAAMTFVGYCYGRRDASLEESLANLRINTLTAASIREGQSDAALRVAETAIGIGADGFERYSAPWGAIRVFFNGQKIPGRDYRIQTFQTTREYLARYSPTAITPAASSYIQTSAQ